VGLSAVASAQGPPSPELDPAQLAPIHAASSPAEALALVERLAARPGAAELGLDYLQGDLLEALGRTDRAARAFATAMRRTPSLAAHARYRLARLELPRHPEIAAGLVAPLIGPESPPELRHQAAVLLRQALGAGGDCRLLERVAWGTLAAADRRPLLVEQAECARAGAPRDAVAQLAAVLAGGAQDEPAREAALRLMALERPTPGGELALALGRTFHHHRRPDLAFAYLAPLVARLPERLDGSQVEALELVAEAQVARGQHGAAAATFGRLAARAQRPELRARALYRDGWTRELMGQPATALSRYVQAANVAPAVEVGPRALLAACRVQWRLGRRTDAIHTYQLLRTRREWEPQALRAAFFLISSQLAQGEEGNAPLLLQQVVQQTGGGASETLYWQARLAELQGRLPAAVALFGRLVRQAPHHPLAGEARLRLAAPTLSAATERALEQWRRSGRADERLQAWLLLPEGDPRREPLRLYLYQRYTRDAHLAPYLRLAAVPPQQWSLWGSALGSAEERLLALDGWELVGLDVVLRHFPVRQPALAFTAAQRLARAGDVRRSVVLVDELARQARGLPSPLLPRPLRELLLPRPWEQRVQTAAGRHRLDPALLWALMRAGSGFDPQALSPWGGRGVLLVDPRHAERLAPSEGLPPVRPEHLFQPGIAIPLGAAYLAELGAAFDGRPHLALAAYLAGTPQARLWGSWCGTSDPAELLSKLDSEEVREVLVRVLSTRAAYAELAEP
jgi:soluble lytic murein transglycosylase